MKINFTSAIDALDKVADGAKQFLPLAASLGGPGVAGVATIVIAASNVAHNLLERANEAKGVATSTDVDKLRAVIADLQEINDKLNERVVAA
jgi:lysyl-tRNA synthetase class I